MVDFSNLTLSYIWEGVFIYIEKEKIKNKRSVYFSFYSYYILVFIVRVYFDVVFFTFKELTFIISRELNV